MKDMSKFQLILTGIFALGMVGGLIGFAMYRSEKSATSAPVTVWGFMTKPDFLLLMEKSGMQKEGSVNVTYVEKDKEKFDVEFINAIADGKAPDVVILGQDQVFRYQNKLMPVPFKSYDERTFKDNFLQEGEVFLTSQGIIAFPLIVDPFVMYWNRNIFQNAAIAAPPQYWDEFHDLTQRLTKKEGAVNVKQATVAFGEYQNVAHAKQIISTLIMQAGSPITERRQGRVANVLTERFGKTVAPAEAAVNFFTEFSNPIKASYTWNRSLPNSKDMFLSGDLALYFGPASELYEMTKKNPNLNFDVTYMPQPREAKNKLTFGMVYGAAIVRTTKSPASAFAFINMLTSAKTVGALATFSGLPPVRRDLINIKQTRASAVVFAESALWARAWIDPDNYETDRIFGDMIGSITGGRARTAEAVGRASSELSTVLNGGRTGQ